MGYRMIGRIAAVGVGLSAAGAAFADPYEPCSAAEARAVSNALMAGASIVIDKGVSEGGVAMGADRCQFRAFFDGGTFCFGEGDTFIAGSHWVEIVGDTVATQAEAREGAAGYYGDFAIATADGGVPEWLAGECDSAPCPLDGDETPVKSTLRQEQDLLFVWRQLFTTLHPPVGDYDVVFTDGHLIWGPFGTSTVRIRVLPREQAEALGAPPMFPPSNFGSVQCPQEE